MLTPASSLTIRRARFADAEGIARVHVASWRTTYRGILKDETLATLRVEERAAMWRNRLGTLSEDPPPRQEACYVAESERDVVGFANGGRVRPVADSALRESYDGELYAIYLAPGGERRGTGERLTHAVAAHLAADGLRSLLIRALAANPNRGFYDALGGVVVFEQDVDIAGEMLHEVGYGWPDIQSLIARTAPRP